MWQDVGLKQLSNRFLNGIPTSLFSVYSLCLIVLWKCLVIGIVQTSDWPDAPLHFLRVVQRTQKIL